jgi:hypothetical protein
MDRAALRAALGVVAFCAWLFVGCLASSTVHAIGSVTGSSTATSCTGFQTAPDTPCVDAAAQCAYRNATAYHRASSFLYASGSNNWCIMGNHDPVSCTAPSYCNSFAAPTDITQLDLENVGSPASHTYHVVVCPANSTLSGSSCGCNAGFRPGLSPTTCSAYSCAGGTDSYISNYQYPPGTAVPATLYFCNTRSATQTHGCTIAFTPSIKATDASTGNTFVWGSGIVSGAQCEGGAAGAGTSPNLPTSSTTPATGVSTATTNPDGVPDAATSCAAGNLPIVIGGVSTCSTAGTVSTVEGSETTTTPAGAASAPPGATPGTVTTETQCSGDVCRQVTTTLDAAGNVVAVNSGGAQSKSDLCKATPTSKVCSGTGGGGGGGGDGSGSGFSGTCAGGFVCTGGEDAVTCAIAVEQHRRDCQFVLSFGDGLTSSLTDKGVAMAAAGDSGDSDHPHRSGNIVSTSLAGGFDQTDALGHGACVADKTIGPVVLPLSKLCDPAETAGQALLGITAIACMFIVFGSPKR